MEAFIQSVFENFDSSIIMVDPSGSIKYSNYFPFVIEGNQKDKKVYDIWPNSSKHVLMNFFDLEEQSERKLKFETSHSKGKRECFFETLINPVYEGEILKYYSLQSNDITSELKEKTSLEMDVLKFQSAIEHSGSIIAISDTEGITNYINYTIGGVKKEDYLGTNVFDWIHPDQQKEVREKFHQTLNDKVPNVYEVGWTDESGKDYWFQTTISPILTGDEITGASWITTDISERKALEEDLKNFNKNLENTVKQRTAELEKTNKNLEEFAYVATHDLRSPILNLKSLTDLMSDDKSIQDSPIFEKLEESVDRINDTLQDLITIAAYKKTLDETYVNLDLSEKVENLKADLAEQIKRYKAEITYDFREIKTLKIPRSHMRSILQNLITNSLKYSSPDREPKIHLSSSFDKDHVVITVKDNGLGIPTEKQDYIFGLFKRLNTDSTGKGMGLYIVKSLVDSLGGKIELESQPGEGSVFRIFFKNQE